MPKILLPPSDPAPTSGEVTAEINAAVSTAIAEVVDGAPEWLNTLKEAADRIAAGETISDALIAQIGAESADRATADQTIQDTVADLLSRLNQEIADRSDAVDAAEAQLALTATKDELADAVAGKLNAADNFADIADADAARVNIGAASAADTAAALDDEAQARVDGDAAQLPRTGNLAQLTDPKAARGNLGLGSTPLYQVTDNGDGTISYQITYSEFGIDSQGRAYWDSDGAAPDERALQFFNDRGQMYLVQP